MENSERNHKLTILSIMIFCIVLVAYRNTYIQNSDFVLELTSVSIAVILVPFVLRMVQSDLFNFNETTKFQDYLVIAGVCIAFGLIANDVIEKATGMAKNSLEQQQVLSLTNKLVNEAKANPELIDNSEDIEKNKFPLLVKKDSVKLLGLAKNPQFVLNDSLILVESNSVILAAP